MPDKGSTFVNISLRHAIPKLAALRMSAIDNGAELTQYAFQNILSQTRRIDDPSHPAG